jgi:hypothetical protein
MTDDARSYADGLHAYAGDRLDPHSLHSWMVQRLMLDLSVAHDEATVVVDETLERRRAAALRHASAPPRHIPHGPHLHLHRAASA